MVAIAEVEAWTTPEGGGSQLQRFDAWGNTTQTAGAAIPQYGYTGRRVPVVHEFRAGLAEHARYAGHGNLPAT